MAVPFLPDFSSFHPETPDAKPGNHFQGGISMGKFSNILKTTIFVCLAAFSLSACGGGGSGNANTPQAAQATVVEGIAAAGAPLTGTVYLSDSSFRNYSTTTLKKPISALINQDGTFSISVEGLKAPFILRATDASGNTLYSFANAPGTANINPSHQSCRGYCSRGNEHAGPGRSVCKP